MGDGQQMFVQVPPGGCGGYVITTQNGQQQIMQPAGAMPQSGVMMQSMPMGAIGAPQPVVVGNNMCLPLQAAAPSEAPPDENAEASVEESEGAQGTVALAGVEDTSDEATVSTALVKEEGGGDAESNESVLHSDSGAVSSRVDGAD